VGDAAAVARALHDLLVDPERARTMGAAGRARVDAEFNIDRTVAAYEQAYIEMLERKRHSARLAA
jgi:glycosyltransferase involved in cell wall biosynthesis